MTPTVLTIKIEVLVAMEMWQVKITALSEKEAAVRIRPMITCSVKLLVMNIECFILPD